MNRTLYSCLFYLALPLVALRLWLRARKAPAYAKRVGERFSYGLPVLQPGGIWVHAVSVGESIAGYATAFWMLTLVVRTIPVGVAYAVWAGMGIVMVSIAALFIYGQKLDTPAIMGMGLIVLGVVVIQLFSKTVGH